VRTKFEHLPKRIYSIAIFAEVSKAFCMVKKADSDQLQIIYDQFGQKIIETSQVSNLEAIALMRRGKAAPEIFDNVSRQEAAELIFKAVRKHNLSRIGELEKMIAEETDPALGRDARKTIRTIKRLYGSTEAALA